MADEDPVRSRAARAAAELALVRVAGFYGGRPEFVLLGGLVPAILCAASDTRHAGPLTWMCRLTWRSVLARSMPHG